MFKDIFHDIVKNALIQEGWTVTDDPLLLQFGGVDLYADLGAEKLLAVEKNGRKIAVEIKSFVGASKVSEFHRAIGQLVHYKMILEINEPERELYLAVPSETYSEFFMLPFTQASIERNKVNLIVYDIRRKEIVKWRTWKK